MIDLTQIDLESLPNVDNRIIPDLRRYFESVMQKEREQKLDCKTDELANALLNGKLRLVVSGKNDCHLRHEDTYDFAGQAVGNLIVVDEEYMNVFVIAHELEHWLQQNIIEMGCLVTEAMAEIGSLYTLGNKEEIVKTVLFRKEISYYQRVHFLLAAFESTGKDIKLLIEAARAGNKDFFYSFIPKKYIESITELEFYIYEGQMVNDFDNTSTIALLYDKIKEFQEYMLKNEKIYPKLRENKDIFFTRMESYFDGYEDFLDEQAQRNRMIKDIVDKYGIVSQRQIEDIKATKPDCQHSTLEDIELQIYRQMLKNNPDDSVFNALVSCYSGYARFQRLLRKSKEIIGEEEFFIIDNMNDFLREYCYINGEAIDAKTGRNKVTIVYREKETGVVKRIENGKDVTQAVRTTILIENDQELDIVGKQLNLDAWERVAREMRGAKDAFGYRFIDSSTLGNQQQFFAKALISYRDGKPYTEEMENYIELLEMRKEQCEEYHYYNGYDEEEYVDYYEEEYADYEDEYSDDELMDNLITSVYQGGICGEEVKAWTERIEKRSNSKDRTADVSDLEENR